MTKTIVVGVGNILFSDEGVGVYAAEYLRRNFSFDSQSSTLEIIDGGTLGFRLMSYFQEYDHVILLDTVSIEDSVGSIFRLPSEALLGLGSYRKTAHEVEIIEMLEICSMLEKIAEVIVIGIVPQDIETVEAALTPKLEMAFDSFVSTVLDELRRLDIHATRTTDVPLKNIIDGFFTSLAQEKEAN